MALYRPTWCNLNDAGSGSGEQIPQQVLPGAVLAEPGEDRQPVGEKAGQARPVRLAELVQVFLVALLGARVRPDLGPGGERVRVVDLSV